MTDPKQNIATVLTKLAERENDYRQAMTDDANAEYAFKLKQAEEYLKADGTVDERKAKALVACKAQYQQHLKASAVKAFTKEALRDAQDALSARQSLLSYDARTNFGYATNKEIT